LRYWLKCFMCSWCCSYCGVWQLWLKQSWYALFCGAGALSQSGGAVQAGAAAAGHCRAVEPVPGHCGFRRRGHPQAPAGGPNDWKPAHSSESNERPGLWFCMQKVLARDLAMWLLPCRPLTSTCYLRPKSVGSIPHKVGDQSGGRAGSAAGHARERGACGVAAPGASWRGLHDRCLPNCRR
jgi:hypothetical protein